MIPAIGRYRASSSGYSANVLMHFNGSDGSTVFLDDGTSGATWSVSTGSPHLTAAGAVYGNAALSLTNANDGIVSNVWPTGLDLSGPFTFTFKWTCPDVNTKTVALTAYSGSGNLILLLFYEANAWHWYAGVYGSTDTRYDFTDVTGYTVGQTYEVAFSRDAFGDIRFARDGVKSDLVFNDTRSWTQTGSIFIGKGPFAPYNPVGIVDELMIINQCLFSTSYVNHTGEYIQGAIVPFTPILPPPNVEFILHFEGSSIVDSGTNYFTIANASIAQTTAQSKFGTQSGAFSGGHLSMNDPSLQLLAKDFTVDCWVYFTSFPGQTFIFDYRNSGGTSGNALYMLGTQLYYYDGSTNVVASSATFVANQWMHIECGRRSGTVYLFIDGVLQGTGTDLGVKTCPSWVIGAAQFFPVGIDPLSGYIDEFHILIGQCLHTASFTPPTAPYAYSGTADPYWEYVTLLMHCDGTGTTFTDSSNITGKLFSTQGSVTQSTVSPLSGTASMLMGGSGSALAVADSGVHEMALSTGDFTIEMTVKVTDISAGFILFWKAFGSAAFNYQLNQQSSGALSFSCFSADGASAVASILTAPGTGIQANAVTHVAVTRAGDTFTLFLNGAVLGTATYSGALLNNTGTGLNIGGFYSVDHPELSLIGQIDEFRITKGFARYTSAFTPSPLPYPSN